MIKAFIKTKSAELGFDRVGIALPDKIPRRDFLENWLSKDYCADMDYLRRNVECRLDPRQRFPWAKSVICVAMNYTQKSETGYPPSSIIHHIAYYARGLDYHDIIVSKLKELCQAIGKFLDREIQSRCYTDTGPILERELAQRAGLGWIGKNTNLIHQQQGSYFFIGVAFIDVQLEPDTPVPNRCGKCRRCIEACPTGALLEPYVLDAQRCLAYLTIEKKGDLTTEEQNLIGKHLFGCDICQEVCPWNRKPKTTSHECYQPKQAYANLTVKDILAMDEQRFRKFFRNTPLYRRKLQGLKRNARLQISVASTASTAK